MFLVQNQFSCNKYHLKKEDISSEPISKIAGSYIQPLTSCIAPGVFRQMPFVRVPLRTQKENPNKPHRSRPWNRESTFCYYHQTYGTKARQCRPPCNFVNPGNGTAGRYFVSHTRPKFGTAFFSGYRFGGQRNPGNENWHLRTTFPKPWSGSSKRKHHPHVWYATNRNYIWSSTLCVEVLHCKRIAAYTGRI